MSYIIACALVCVAVYIGYETITGKFRWWMPVSMLCNDDFYTRKCVDGYSVVSTYTRQSITCSTRDEVVAFLNR